MSGYSRRKTDMSEPPMMYNGKVVKDVEPFMLDGDDSLPYYTTPRLLALTLPLVSFLTV